MSFNKFVKGLKKDDNKLRDEEEAKIRSVMAEANEIFNRRQVTVKEMNIILQVWTKLNTEQLLDLNNKAFMKIAELEDKLKQKND